MAFASRSLLVLLASACSVNGKSDSDPVDADVDTATLVDGGTSDDATPKGGGPLDYPDVHKPLSAMTFHDECGETGSAACAECERRAREHQSECWTACNDAVVYGGPVISCVDLCGDISSSNTCSSQCSGGQDTCIRRSYRFEPTAMSDAAILEACIAATERDAECGETNVGTDCDIYARVEKSEVADVYACTSKVECDADVETCFSALGASSLATEVASWCVEEELDERIRGWLEVEGTWTRSDVQQDLQVCKTLCGSGDFEECVRVWLEATMGP